MKIYNPADPLTDYLNEFEPKRRIEVKHDEALSTFDLVFNTFTGTYQVRVF